MEVLRGGYTNDGQVVRMGDTVRRPWRETSPATQALLDHLERAGFEGAPRFLGRDEDGREVLSYVPGRAAIEPHEPWALSDGALVSVARLLRRFHAAVAGFDARRHTWPQRVPCAFQDGSVSHNDPNLDYELPAAERGRVVDALVEAHEWCYRIVRGALRNGHEPFERMWRAGGEAKAGRTRAWLAAHDEEMRNAIR
jgi:hypothetical protein